MQVPEVKGLRVGHLVVPESIRHRELAFVRYWDTNPYVLRRTRQRRIIVLNGEHRAPRKGSRPMEEVTAPASSCSVLVRSTYVHPRAASTAAKMADTNSARVHGVAATPLFEVESDARLPLLAAQT